MQKPAPTVLNKIDISFRIDIPSSNSRSFTVYLKLLYQLRFLSRPLISVRATFLRAARAEDPGLRVARVSAVRLPAESRRLNGNQLICRIKIVISEDLICKYLL